MAEVTEHIHRHRTAMKRSSLSRPIQLAVTDGLLTPTVDLLDYGCGLGDDVDLLLSSGINAVGWDSTYRPLTGLAVFPIVNLGYVVNVIENLSERAAALRDAWHLAGRLLIVSGRLISELKTEAIQPFNDGFITKSKTFQKYYEQNELRQWIEEVLGESAVAAAPGIFYIFRDSDWKEVFLASKVRRPPAAEKISSTISRFSAHQELLKPLIEFIAHRGRLPEGPEQGEFETIVGALGSLRRAFRLIVKVTGADQWEIAKRERTQDLLVYLALSRFGGRPQRKQLPSELLIDVRAFFGTYRNACDNSDRLLFEAGNRAAIDAAFRVSPVGKRTQSALYVHRRAVANLPPVLRVLEGCARRLVGEVEGANIIKLHRDAPRVSYLGYPDFDIDPHPALAGSLLVHLQTFKVSYRDYTTSDNPPILHRKEEFIMPDDSNYEAFRLLTMREEEVGLYQDPESIGTLQAWRSTLERTGVSIIDGHILVSINSP